MENKRLWTRLLTEGEGNFFANDIEIYGEMSLNNYSRKGFRASLNKSVEPGCNLLIEVNLPRQNMPIWADGTVVWIRDNEENEEEKFEAGVELNEIDIFDIKQVPDECYKDKYLEKAADYAFKIGMHTKRDKNVFFKNSCSIAGLFILYFFLGSLLTLINVFFAFFYAATVAFYFLFLIVKKRDIVFTDKFSIISLFRKKNLLRIAGIILNDLCSGLFFIAGLAARGKSNLASN